MDGYIVNNSGKAIHVFKRNFAIGHKVFLSDIWPQYKDRIVREYGKKNITEEEFVKWLEANSFMMSGFVYHPSNLETATMESDTVESTSSDTSVFLGEQEDGQLLRPSLANARPGMIEKLTAKDITELRVVDDPKKIVGSITNIHKLRRAYTAVRNMPRKSMLTKIIRERLQELESI